MIDGLLQTRRARRRRGDSAFLLVGNLSLVVIASCLLLLFAVVSAQTCPSLSPGLCSSNANCNGGICDRGVCRACPAGKIGEFCQANDVFLNAGNVVVTQAGLDFAPIQYFKPLNDAYEEAKSSGLTTTPYVGPCTEVDGNRAQSFKVHINGLVPQNFAQSDLLQDTIRFEVIPGGLRASATSSFVISKARLDLWGGALCCPCNGEDCTDTFCPRVCSKNDPNDWIDFSFKATVSADILIAYSAALQGVSATVQNVNIAFDDSSLGAVLNCPTTGFQLISNLVKSYFEEMKGQIGPTLLPSLTTAFTNTANRIAKKYQGVQSYSPFAGASVLYKVVNLTVVAATPHPRYISADVQAKLVYTYFNDSPIACPRINVTYADLSSDSALLPPVNWAPVTKALSPSGLYSPILAGNRMTRSFFNAVVWAKFQDPASRRRNFTFTAPNVGLAAQAEVQLSVPFFKIPNLDPGGDQSRLRVTTNGNFKMSCAPTRSGTVLSADFSQFDSSFVLTYDDTPPDPSIAFQVVPGRFAVGTVSSIQSQDPSIANATLLRSAMEGAMNFKVSTLDRFLLEKGNGVLTLPPDLQQSFPDAQLAIVSQGTQGGIAIPNESGYIEMINRCACSSSPRPIENQGVDGVVNICPASFLSKNYCADLKRRRRRMATEDEETTTRRGRSLSTPQQEADLTVVLGALGTMCVTKAPSKSPTTPAPTKRPTPRPTRRPTTFAGVAQPPDACEERNGCFYDRDVLFFVCKDGYKEVKDCRNANNDVFCCPDRGAATSGGSAKAMMSSWWVAVAGPILVVVGFGG